MSIKGKGHILGPGIEESNCNLCLTTYNNDERGASIAIYEDKKLTLDEEERRREHYITIPFIDIYIRSEQSLQLPPLVTLLLSITTTTY